MTLSFNLTENEKAFLGRQAVLAIQSQLHGDLAARPLTPQSSQDSCLGAELGSFVTLTINGALRGCIGTIIGHEPLYLNVWNMARSAAFQDPRFPPLSAGEWASAEMEISVLDAPTLCPDPEKIKIGRDGLILQYDGRSGVFLPQVPVEQGWSLPEYLEHLCLKAGLPLGSWKKPGARLYWYQADVFPVSK